MALVISAASGVYARDQARVGAEEQARAIAVAKYRSLGAVARGSVKLESALLRCLQSAQRVEECTDVLKTAEDDIELAARDPELATYFPDLHRRFDTLYESVHDQQIWETIDTLQRTEAAVDDQIRELNVFDSTHGMWLAFRADDIQADAALIKKFENQRQVSWAVQCTDGPRLPGGC